MRNRKRGSGVLWIFVLLGIVIGAVLVVRILDMTDQLDSRRQILAGINTRIQKAEEKTEEIRDEIRYRETDDYIEDQARESLGLRYPDEIIVVPDTEQE